MTQMSDGTEAPNAPRLQFNQWRGQKGNVGARARPATRGTRTLSTVILVCARGSFLRVKAFYGGRTQAELRQGLRVAHGRPGLSPDAAEAAIGQLQSRCGPACWNAAAVDAEEQNLAGQEGQDASVPHEAPDQYASAIDRHVGRPSHWMPQGVPRDRTAAHPFREINRPGYLGVGC